MSPFVFFLPPVRVFSVSDCQWTCAIDEGLLPVVAASWAPDSLHIVTASDCGMRLSVWSLCATPAEDPLRLVVMRPKFPSAGRAFSPSGAFWAVCTRVDCKDFLEIFHVSQDWVKLRDFQVKTDDLQGLLWTPSETSLVVWDTPLLVSCRGPFATARKSDKQQSSELKINETGNK
ncbi:WDR8 protein isoform 3 family protein [Toxoplasma gondii TgCatPRC2]|uniref:WDR8 protein isoform 3 family protein n=1 Tax=Toxoplasma gondii TgCatPRC2 TaxID=1130821 RepID=A0A151H544_TOXGO|nr:WDR8 protein isoform 3 family protein [Toxoplasma gondii TgCatPRC2]